jgi:hypothetical protein
VDHDRLEADQNNADQRLGDERDDAGPQRQHEDRGDRTDQADRVLEVDELVLAEVEQPAFCTCSIVSPECCCSCQSSGRPAAFAQSASAKRWRTRMAMKRSSTRAGPCSSPLTRQTMKISGSGGERPGVGRLQRVDGSAGKVGNCQLHQLRQDQHRHERHDPAPIADGMAPTGALEPLRRRCGPIGGGGHHRES